MPVEGRALRACAFSTSDPHYPIALHPSAYPSPFSLPVSHSRSFAPFPSPLVPSSRPSDPASFPALAPPRILPSPDIPCGPIDPVPTVFSPPARHPPSASVRPSCHGTFISSTSFFLACVASIPPILFFPSVPSSPIASPSSHPHPPPSHSPASPTSPSSSSSPSPSPTHLILDIQPSSSPGLIFCPSIHLTSRILHFTFRVPRPPSF
ncbi:hypothetical protein DFH09DRAFT_1334268 [Mycena vulgaris]|nr:hypothetical protein DFH09DRAFT_1334268 [Mycena vulgaris]